MRYDVDDRGNVVDFYALNGSPDGGEWDRVARLDREAGDTADQLAWDNWYADNDLEAWAIEKGYPILEAKQNAAMSGCVAVRSTELLDS